MRTKKIVNRVEIKLKQDAQAPVKADFRLILDSLNSVQLDIARRGAIKEEVKLTLESGTGVYDLTGDIFKITGIKQPSSWNYEFKVIANKNLFSEYENTVFSTSQPLYGMVWNKNFKLTPVPQTTGEELSLYVFLLPSQDLTLTGDPEVGPEYDKALEYGVLADLAGGDWKAMYEMELSKLLSQSLNETTEPMVVQHWQDKLGF